MALQRVANFGELGEHQGAFALGQHFRQHVSQAFEFMRAIGRRTARHPARIARDGCKSA